MSMPQTMQAVVFHQTGGPEVLESVTLQLPEMLADEVLVRVQAAGVNRADIIQRLGRYPVPTDNPVPGLEVAGEIVAVGKQVTGWKPGDHVCALVEGGGYAEYASVAAIKLLRWPDGYDAIRAAALPEAHFTVWANLFQAGHLHAGETALVHGGRGGVGATAIVLARAFGARVLATSGSAEGCADCLALGAHVAINYRAEAFADAVKRATDGRGVDVTLDPIGAANFDANLSALAMGGRLVIIGFTGGSKLEQADLTPILTRRLVVTGSAMRPRSAAQKGAIAQELLQSVWPRLDRGQCGPVIARTFPLAQAADAHRLMEQGGYLGKVILRIAD